MKINFQNSHGQKLVGVLDKPEGDGVFPAVINCHGFTSRKDWNMHPPLNEACAKNKMVALRFDFTGVGESQGEFSEGTMWQQVKDVQSAIEYLLKLNYVDKDKIYLVGHSMGAAVCVLAAEIEPRLKKIVCVSPPINYLRWADDNLGDYDEKLKTGHIEIIKHHHTGEDVTYNLDSEYVQSALDANIMERIRKITIPKLIIYGTEDDSASSSLEEVKQLFENAVEPKKLKIIGGADHNFKNPEHRAVLIDTIVEFLK